MSLFEQTFRTLFKEPIVIFVKGDWRTGKTDTSFLIAYLCLVKWKIIDKVASNQQALGKNANLIAHITDVGKVKQWLHADRSEKLFILDEALKYAYRRKAMSQMNIEIISEILPELSKGHGRLMVLSQIEKLDSDLLHPAFCRGELEKLDRKTMVARSRYWFGERTLEKLPRSPIRFDKDSVAQLTFNKKVAKVTKVPREQDHIICDLYANQDLSITRIEREKGYHREEIRRAIKRGLSWFVEHCEESKTENVNISENAPLEERD